MDIPVRGGETSEEEEEEEEQDEELEAELAELADLPIDELAARIVETVTAEFQADPTTLSLVEVETKLTQLLTSKLPQDTALPPEMQANINTLARLLQSGLLQSFATTDSGFGFVKVERWTWMLNWERCSKWGRSFRMSMISGPLPNWL
jgi:hypothetical protein